MNQCRWMVGHVVPIVGGHESLTNLVRHPVDKVVAPAVPDCVAIDVPADVAPPEHVWSGGSENGREVRTAQRATARQAVPPPRHRESHHAGVVIAVSAGRLVEGAM